MGGWQARAVRMLVARRAEVGVGEIWVAMSVS